MFDVRHHDRPTAPAAPTGRRRLALPLVAGVLALTLAASGCAATAAAADPASDELTASLQDWAALNAAGQREVFDADLRELGALVIEAAGLPEVTGMDAAAIEAALTRFVQPELPATNPAAQEPASDTTADTESADEMLDEAGLGDVDLGGLKGMTPEEIAALTPEELAELAGGGAGGGGGRPSDAVSGPIVSVSPSAATSVGPASFTTVPPSSTTSAVAVAMPSDTSVTAQGAALDAARNIVGDLVYSLDRAGKSGTQSLTYTMETEGYTTSSSVKDGMAITGTTYEVYDTIDDVAVVLESTMDANVEVCPDADGRVQGQFRITGTLHHADADGEPLMTRVSMQVSLDAVVDDSAWASQGGGDFLAEIETGRPTPAGEFAGTPVKQANSGTLAVDYYPGGQGASVGKVGVSNPRGGGPLGAVGRDIAAKVQQGALDAVQKYWRTGNCVYAQVDASPEQIDRGGSSELTVTGYPMQGQGRIPVATAAYTGVNQGTVQGTVAPGSAKQTPATYTFKAAESDGIAQPEFKITSKRGIGFGFAVIRVGQSGWAVDWTGENGERITGVKCDGIPGTWELTGTSDYTWGGSAVMEIGEDLSGTITWSASVTADKLYEFAGTRPASFEARAGGYMVITEGGELPVRKATSAECG